MELPLIVKWWEGQGEGTGQGLKGDTFLLYPSFFGLEVLPYACYFHETL